MGRMAMLLWVVMGVIALVQGKDVRVLDEEIYADLPEVVRDNLPDVWGEGALFAFSGMDGQTIFDEDKSYVGTTFGRKLGFRFHSSGSPGLWVAFWDGELFSDGSEDHPFQEIRPVVVGNDLIEVEVEVLGGKVVRVKYVASDAERIYGQIRSVVGGVRAGVIVDGKGLQWEKLPDGWKGYNNRAGFTVRVCKGKPIRAEEYGVNVRAVVAEIPEGSAIQFVWSRGDAEIPSGEVVISECRQRLEFLKHLKLPRKASPREIKTYIKCAWVQKVNCMAPEGVIPFRWTTPDRWPHRKLVFWDSVFHAFGLRYLSGEWAQDSLKAVAAGQREDGTIPRAYRPTGHFQDVAPQMLLAWGSWNVYEQTHDLAFLKWMYPRISAFFESTCNMDPAKGPLGWPQFGNASMDNSPRFDRYRDLICVDLNSYLVNDCWYLAKMADELGMKDEAKLWRKRYAMLAEYFRNILWDEEDGIFYDRRATGEFVRIKTVASFMPLFAGIATQEQAERLRRHLRDEEEFWLPFPVPSVAMDEETFCDDMWRGPVWTNCNFLVAEGLERYGYGEEARALRERSIQEVMNWYLREGVIYEFFDPFGVLPPDRLHRKGKVGAGAEWIHTSVRDYGWTSALFMEMLMQRDSQIP